MRKLVKFDTIKSSSLRTRRRGHLESWTKIFHCPMRSGASERSGARERSEQCGASERVSGASERANGQASGPVLTSRFLAFLTHRALMPHREIDTENIVMIYLRGLIVLSVYWLFYY